MKIWFNKINESRRSMVEVAEAEVTIGRDPANTVCLQSPLVSRRHAVVRLSNGKLQLENVGLNSCIVGDEEVLGGQTAVFEPGTKVRIWPYTLTFEAEKAAVITRAELEAHLRSIMADLELRIHRKLLERLDLYEFETNRGRRHRRASCCWRTTSRTSAASWASSAPENEPLLEEITGLTLRDHLVNQLIMETGTRGVLRPGVADHATSSTCRPRSCPSARSELHGLLQFLRERLNLHECRDVSRAGAAGGNAASTTSSTWSARTCTTNCASTSSSAR